MHGTERSSVSKMRLTIAGLLFSASGAQAASPNMQPGMWEIITTMQIPGMPMSIPPQTVKPCFKKEDLKESKDTLPDGAPCKIEDLMKAATPCAGK